MPNIPHHTQIAVVGAGPVGVLCALLLAQQGKRVLLIEARPAGAHIRDSRTIALSSASVRAFRKAGIAWPEAAATAIRQVHVSQQHHFGRTLLRAEDILASSLGQTCDYSVLTQACESALEQAGLPVLWQARLQNIRTLRHFAELEFEYGGQSHSMTADWAVLAEGGILAAQLPGIRCRSHDYRQSALVATLQFETPQNSTAYERFADGGPLALLPYGSGYRLVWTRSHEDAERLKEAESDHFAAEFQTAFGSRLGKLQSRGECSVFPLRFRQLSPVYSGRAVCIGNAAQTLHPVAAQGLNLGVRDAVSLAACFAQPASLTDSSLAGRYAALRRSDVQTTVGFTHSLVTLFDRPDSLRQLGRGGAMSILDSIPALRKAFTEYLISGI